VLPLLPQLRRIEIKSNFHHFGLIISPISY